MLGKGTGKSMDETHIDIYVFDKCVSPTLTYGCQSWSLTKKQENKIKTFQNQLERKILGITWKDKNTIKIKQKTKISNFTKTLKLFKWIWQDTQCKNKQVGQNILEWTPLDRKRKKGRQKKR